MRDRQALAAVPSLKAGANSIRLITQLPLRSVSGLIWSLSSSLGDRPVVSVASLVKASSQVPPSAWAVRAGVG